MAHNGIDMAMKVLKKSQRVFLDHAGATPTEDRVLAAMMPYFKGSFANPSALYAEGVTAKNALLEARKKVAACLSAHADEIVFTSSGTESDNLAIFGTFASAVSKKIVNPHIITSAFEHPAVLEAVLACEKQGAKVSYLKPNKDGFIDPGDVKKALTKKTILVSCMYANNEIGTIQPIREIAKVIRHFKKHSIQKSAFPYFHIDASQAAVYAQISVEDLHADLLTLDGAKIYGPKGIGMLFVRRGVHISPMILGGGQEEGRRSGTESLPLIVGFAEAFSIAATEAVSEAKRVLPLRELLIKGVLHIFPRAHLNGSLEMRLPNNANFCFPGQDGEFLVLRLDAKGIAVSGSSSCRTLSENIRSYVVDLLGDARCGESSVRFTLGKSTTKKDIQYVLSVLKKMFS